MTLERLFPQGYLWHDFSHSTILPFNFLTLYRRKATRKVAPQMGDFRNPQAEPQIFSAAFQYPF
jgi:hypothetical protein